jgi:hypothetical protein
LNEEKLKVQAAKNQSDETLKNNCRIGDTLIALQEKLIPVLDLEE